MLLLHLIVLTCVCSSLSADDVTSESGFSRVDDSDVSGRSTPIDGVEVPGSNASDTSSRGSGRRKKSKPTQKRHSSFVNNSYWTRCVSSSSLHCSFVLSF